MAQEMSPERRLAEERAAANAESFTTFKACGKGGIPPTELDVINPGDILTIPEDFHIYQEPVRGTTNKMVYVVSEEGKRLFPSILTRGAKPADGGDYVRPSGTVVEAIKAYGDMDKFFAEKMKGKKIKFESMQEVIAEDRFNPNGGTRTVKVWKINFVA